MKVSARSWHMQLVRAGEPTYVPRDLCSHFWRVFWCITIPLGMLALLGWALVLFVKDIFIPHPTEVGIFVGTFVIGFSLFLAARAIGRQSANRVGHSSLVMTYLKAKKRRICPLIEVVE